MGHPLKKEEERGEQSRKSYLSHHPRRSYVSRDTWESYITRDAGK